MSTILITGASTGIGNLTARALARDGHTVFASMRDVTGRNAEHAKELVDLAAVEDLALRVIELDVQSQDSANAAVATVLEDNAPLDVVIHNAGHLVIGYAEAFTAEDLKQLFDINVFGMQRVNRAALAHIRERRSGTLLYVGSTSTISVPPFLAPYVASKAAFDALAAATAYEVGRFGIETTIVMPGAFTSGTEHYPHAGHASDQKVTEAYAPIDPLVARNEAATNRLFTSGVSADPQTVADEIVRILRLPVGQKPLRSVVDFTNSHVDQVNEVVLAEQRDFLSRMGFAELLSAEIPSRDPLPVHLTTVGEG
jgi:NAD(P)-dependent dehydrogenase (short-subunit alcohol dehydrogenase family)